MGAAGILARAVFCLVLLGSTLVSCEDKTMDAPLTFSYTPEEIEALCNAGQDQLKKALDVIGSQSLDSATFAKTVMGIETVTTAFSNELNPILFLKYVSPN